MIFLSDSFIYTRITSYMEIWKQYVAWNCEILCSEAFPLQLNVLIDDSGKGVLGDFGLSRVTADVTSRTAELDGGNTAGSQNQCGSGSEGSEAV